MHVDEVCGVMFPSHEDPRAVSEVCYFIREKLYGTASALCEQTLQEAPSEKRFVILNSYCLVKLGKVSQAIRLLNTIKRDKDVGLAAMCALKMALQAEATIDAVSLRDVEMEMNSIWNSANATNCYLAGLVLMFEGLIDRATPLVDRAIREVPNNGVLATIRGWLDVRAGKDIKEAMRLFDVGIRQDLPDALLGKAKLYESRHNVANMEFMVKALLEKYPNFIPGHIEAVKCALTTRNIEALNERLQNGNLVTSDCLILHLIELIRTVTLHGDLSNITSILSDINETVTSTENDNPNYQLYLAQLLSRTGFEHPPILQFCRKLLDRALTLDRRSAFLVEKSRLLLQEGDFKQARMLAMTALEIDMDPDPSVLLGVVRCYIAEGNISEAVAQMQFVRSVNAEIQKSMYFHFYQALIDRAQQKPADVVLTGIRSATDILLSNIQSIPFGLDFLYALNPAFLNDMALVLFDYAPLVPSKMPTTSIRDLNRLLTTVNDSCPGLTRITYLLAKTKFLLEEFEESQKLLLRCIERNPTVAESYLLLAQIALKRDQLEKANKYLDDGLSNNFQVREHPLFHVTKARLMKQSNQLEPALAQLNMARQLEAMKEGVKHDKKKREKFEVTESDKIAVYLEAIDCLQRLRKYTEADELMKEAMKRWQGTPEEHQLVMLNVEIRLQKGAVDEALKSLQNVQPNDPNYQEARIRMAKVYLEDKKDKRQFAICYKQILDHNPSPEAFSMLGDAYMSIQEPLKAVEVYEAAIKKNPKDHVLALKIGDAYVKCHLYAKAVTFYEAALKTSQLSIIRHKFAEQMFKMGSYDKCEKVLRDGLAKDPNPIDIPVMQDHVAYLMLLAKVDYERGTWEGAIENLVKAKDMQMRLISKLPGKDSNIEQRALASKICCDLAEYCMTRRESAKAAAYYQEALTINKDDIKVMIQLATLRMSMNELDMCEHHCVSILKLEENNDEATLMMADVLYQKNDSEQAALKFSKLLDRNPNQYHALARCIELSWRRGEYDLAEKYLSNALENNPRATVDAGFNYCKGLHEWYTGEPNAALQAFNRARRDLEWGERAIYNMIEICLNPDNEIIGGEVFEHNDENNAVEQSEKEMGAKTAERFLKELRYKPGLDHKYRCMESFILLATGNRNNATKALSNFLEIIETECSDDDKPLNVAAILGSSRAYMFLKQMPKAKLQLKRVLNYPWTLEDADYLEQCWLLLTDLYINQGKHDQAISVIRTILQHNASSIKAYEFMGYLMEKDQKWNDAIKNYEDAWTRCKHRNPTIGYKLSYVYLKQRRFFDCIHVCHKVLEQYPNNLRIRRDILEKARTSLRC
ncbi:hypothetical protein QR680_001248 [Steinernema hermaphroditum]|uniref:Tetratricopeptide repeat protein 21B n=1 Tax=Steinernema hermaphroditum TaxID=289476 RepID=A0AA39LFM3_9BILA|nr:hypothetical protein QR680_001248 [Steinernema hermaphroditum]